MMNLMERFFGKKTKVRSSGEEKTTTHDTRVATCALFLEMAGIDGAFSESERERIISILRRDFGLSDESVTELLEASNDELAHSIDLWQFTNLINQHYLMEEKIRIIEMVWKIVYVDGKLDKHEDYLVHKLAKLLRVTHKQLIDAKVKILHGGG